MYNHERPDIAKAMAGGPAKREEKAKVKVSIRARGEHTFRVVERQFGFVKVRFRGFVVLTL